MSKGEFDSDPTGLSPLRRYHNDISKGLKHGFNKVDIHTTLSKLFLAEGVLDDNADMEPLFGYIDTILEQKVDVRIQFEQFMLLPLREIAPLIEVTRTPKQIAKWYEENLFYLKPFNDNDHDYQCIEESMIDLTDACVNSNECPYVVASRVLTADIYNPDFNNLDYQYDHVRKFRIVMKKLHIAKNDNVFKAAYSEMDEEEYLNRYYRFFPEYSPVENPESQT
jgi:hypothetical protein